MKRIARMMAACLLGFTCLSATAAAFPERPIKIVIGFPAGGPTDVIARILGKHMGDTLGQPIMVVNQTGANSLIATREVQRAQPDGYTLLFASLSHNVNPLLMKQEAGYDPLADFEPISLAATLPLVLIAPHGSPVGSVQELLEQARKAPGTITYGSAGNGGSAHLAAAMMATQADTQMVHVPFRGNGPAMTEMMAGRISFMFYPIIGVADNISNKRIKALAVGSGKPLPAFPGVPTMDESGFPGFEKTAPWVGMLAPAKTPTPVIDKLNAAMVKALNDPEVQKQLENLGAVTVGDSPTEFRRYLEEDKSRWAQVIDAAKISN
jgi:tripartite-type tricarboxylate transporter receptor subunit TctC